MNVTPCQLKSRRDGLEPSTFGSVDRCSESITNDNNNTYKSDEKNLAFCLALLNEKSPDLALLVERWDDLSAPAKAGITAMVKAAVKATILAETKGATLKEIEREAKSGTTVYEAEWIVDGREIEIKVAADGTLLKKEVEYEEKNSLDQAPAIVREARLPQATFRVVRSSRRPSCWR